MRLPSIIATTQRRAAIWYRAMRLSHRSAIARNLAAGSRPVILHGKKHTGQE